MITSTNQQCQNPGCAYGQLFDSVNCVCKCYAGFSGLMCDFIDCSLAKDAFVCGSGISACVSDYEKGMCPWTCGINFFIF
jgi:hypothetical protein